MRNIVTQAIGAGDIEQCRELCDELMAFQKSKAFLEPERFDCMTFDTRMKKSCQNALRSHTVIAKEDGIPAGYVFSTIDEADESARRTFPEWAPAGAGFLGFYPEWVSLPQKIGCLSNLYIRDKYRGSGLGKRLLGQAMEWLESFSDTRITFVYISNGNDDALNFYLKNGFTYSHEVFGGFIKAAYKYKG